MPPPPLPEQRLPQSNGQAGAHAGRAAMKDGAWHPPPLPSAPAAERVSSMLTLALDAKANFLYVCEQSNHCVRRLTLS
eukprot:1571257-Pleurochrysis_carterae.AAC.1